MFLGEHITPTHIVDLGLRFGEYGSKWNLLDTSGLSIKKLKENPHGIDLGELRPVLPKKLHTPGKKISLAPEVFCKDLVRLDQSRREVGQDELLLIGRRELRTNNSWLHNSQRMIKGKQRCTLLMHPQDAFERALENGQSVHVRSRVGHIEVPVQISDEIMPGVVSLPHGWGHGRKGARLNVASSVPGASINDLTDETRVDVMSGVAALSGTPVTVEAAVKKTATRETHLSG
jgi:anaerobic selenocysteine-containing dehydrogenase